MVNIRGLPLFLFWEDSELRSEQQIINGEGEFLEGEKQLPIVITGKRYNFYPRGQRP